MIRWTLSLLFNVQIYVAMGLVAVAYAPLVLIDDAWALRAVRAYCRHVRWSARWMLGLHSVIRGEVPRSECLIAAKHQSFLDIIMIVSAVPRPRFVMKKELMRTPIVGWYAKKIGCVPVDRGRRGRAVRQLVEDVGKGRLRPGQLIIYPQGSRIAPGDSAPYKIGTAVLYEQLAQPCVPAATNVGLFWPRQSVVRRPGLAVVEFLPPIAPGLSHDDLMARLEHEIESASDRLLAEAGLPGAPPVGRSVVPR